MPNALVTGTSSGFGLATVERLAQLGWSVIAAQRDPSTARHDAPYDTVAIDLRDGASITKVGNVVDALDGGLDVLVSNAGFGILGPLEEVSDAELRDQLEVNLVGTLALCRACLPALRRAGGVIVQVSSVSGQVGFRGMCAYNASKFGLEGASEALAMEVESQGVRVVLVEPGTFRTSIAAKSPRIRGRGASGLYPELWEELDAFAGYLDSDAEDATIAIDAIVAAATVPGAPFRLPVGSGISPMIRAKLEKMLVDLDDAEAFLASSRDYVRGTGSPDLG